MDRVQFVRSINENSNISPEMIVQSFDHIMAMYNIVGTSGNIDVCGVIEGPVVMSFSIRFNDYSSAKIMQDMIREKMNSTVAIYGKVFNINNILEDNILNIKILP